MHYGEPPKLLLVITHTRRLLRCDPVDTRGKAGELSGKTPFEIQMDGGWKRVVRAGLRGQARWGRGERLMDIPFLKAKIGT